MINQARSTASCGCSQSTSEAMGNVLASSKHNISDTRSVTTRCKGGPTLVTFPRTVTPYRDSVDATHDRVTYQKSVTWWRYRLVRCAVSGRRIKGMMRLQPEQAWTCDVTHHCRLLLCPSFHSRCYCLWRVVPICSVVWFVERFGNCKMDWTQGSVVEFIKTQRQCQPFLNRNGFPDSGSFFEISFSNQIN